MSKINSERSSKLHINRSSAFPTAKFSNDVVAERSTVFLVGHDVGPQIDDIGYNRSDGKSSYPSRLCRVGIFRW